MPRTKGATAFQPGTVTGYARLLLCLKHLASMVDDDPYIEHPPAVRVIGTRVRVELVPKGAAPDAARWWLEYERQPVGGWPAILSRRGPLVREKESNGLYAGTVEWYWRRVHDTSVQSSGTTMVDQWRERVSGWNPEADRKAWARVELWSWHKKVTEILAMLDATVVRVIPSSAALSGLE